jgi:hypothetical protein
MDRRRSKPRFLSSSIWPYITAAVKRKPNQCHVAVAYFGNGASRLLPLQAKSILVVDLSVRAVSSGQTNPSELLVLIRRGVQVHCVDNLHAKVFVLGDRAVVSSSNASQSSANGLIEAGIIVTEPSSIRACRDFVTSLTGEQVTIRHAQIMQRLYRPPRSGAARGHRHRPNKVLPKHSVFWVAPLFWDATRREHDEADKGLEKATKKLTEPKQSHIEWFSWAGAKSAQQATIGDLVLCVTRVGQRRFADSPARIVDIRRYTTGAIIYLERRKNSRRKSVDGIVRQLSEAKRHLSKNANIRRLRDALLIHDLIRLWPYSAS